MPILILAMTESVCILEEEDDDNNRREEEQEEKCQRRSLFPSRVLQETKSVRDRIVVIVIVVVIRKQQSIS